MGIAMDLDTAIKAAGIPIFGVSIGTTADKGTWRVDFMPEATEQQRTDAAALVAAFVPTPE